MQWLPRPDCQPTLSTRDWGLSWTSSGSTSAKETFERVQSAIPNASDFLNRFESSPEAAGGGGLLGALTGLAAKFLGGGAGDLTKLLETFAKLGFKPEQIEAFLPRAIAFIQSHLPADLFQQILERFPGLSPAAGANAE